MHVKASEIGVVSTVDSSDSVCVLHRDRDWQDLVLKSNMQASGLDITGAPASGKCTPTHGTTSIQTVNCSVVPDSDEDYAMALNSGVLDSSGITARFNRVNHLCNDHSSGSQDEVTESADVEHLQDLVGYRVPPSILFHPSMELRLRPRHTVGGINSQLNASTWNYYLQFEEDLSKRDYLSDGIANGFSIVDMDGDIDSYFCENYTSVLTGEAYDYVDNLISNEILDGKYVLASSIPKCVHSLGAIPKQDGSFRPITDCRRPEGISINNHMLTTFQPFNYVTMDQVAANVTSNCYMATVDIASAYRSVANYVAN